MTNNILSFAGAGGKTYTINKLANKFKKMGKSVVVCTTTKMNVPKKGEFDFIISKELEKFIFFQDFFSYSVPLENVNVADFKSKIGYFITNLDLESKKFIHITDDEILYLSKIFDIVLIESDEAKMRDLKAPKRNEPVISKHTTHSITVLNISCVGKKISRDSAYNFPIFSRITGIKEGDKLKINHLLKLLNYKFGCFKNFRGHKILLLNNLFDNKDLKNAKKIKKFFKRDNYENLHTNS